MTCLMHKLAQGFGGMGDGYVCVKCGYDSYSRPLNATVLPERNDEMHFNEYPFVIRFSAPVTFNTNTSDWAHFYPYSGELLPRDML
jgi:hypothetical protein